MNAENIKFMKKKLSSLHRYSWELLFTVVVNVDADVKCKIKIVLHKKNYRWNLFIRKFGNFLLSLLCQRDKWKFHSDFDKFCEKWPWWCGSLRAEYIPKYLITSLPWLRQSGIQIAMFALMSAGCPELVCTPRYHQSRGEQQQTR